MEKVERAWEAITKEDKILLVVMGMFTILTIVKILMGVNTYVKNYQTEHFKYLQLVYINYASINMLFLKECTIDPLNNID